MKIYIFILIIVIIILVVYFTDYFAVLKELKKENVDNIAIKNDVINFSSLTLKQKIAQMILVRGDGKENITAYLNIGGIFLGNQKSAGEYEELIKEHQKNSKIKLFVATDLEGTWNPFSNFKFFPKFSEIKDKEEAYWVGKSHGEILIETGF